MSDLKEKVTEFLNSKKNPEQVYSQPTVAESLFDWCSVESEELTYKKIDEYEPDDDYSGCIGYIYRFTDGEDEIFVDIFGIYRSHDGAYYHGWCFAKQVTKTVTVWE